MNGESSSGPLAFMQHEANAWRTLWTHPDPSYVPDRIFPLLDEIRARAQYAPLNPITFEQLEKAISRIVAGKACGVEQLGGRAFRALPYAAKDGLLKVLHAVEATGTWPWQIQVVLVSLLGKPAGGDRAIGLFSEVARLWAAIRSPFADAWTTAMAGKWDQAVRGSSSLRCALVRAFRDECIALASPDEHLCAASSCWDIRAFYDTLQLEPILREGLRLEFPPLFLLLETILYMGPRAIRRRGAYGPIVQPTRSLVAGARRAVDFSRCILYALMEELSNRFLPAVVTSTWVDDVVQRAEGLRRQVVATLLSAGRTFAEGVEGLGLTLASKSAVVATSFDIAKELQQKFLAMGISVKAKNVTADLGVDRGTVVGGRPKLAKRRKIAASRLQRVYKVARLSKCTKALAKKLLFTGIGPQRTYAAGVFGVAPSVVLSWRRSIGRTLSPGMRGRCLDTFLQLEVGARDPHFATAFQVLDAWIYLLSQPAERKRAERAWPRARKLVLSWPPNKRWRRATGVTYAVICLLLDIGWQPDGPWDWVSDVGERFCVPDDAWDSGEELDWGPFKVAFS